MRSPLTEFVAQIIAYILDFKRLQQMAFAGRLPLFLRAANTGAEALYLQTEIIAFHTSKAC